MDKKRSLIKLRNTVGNKTSLLIDYGKKPDLSIIKEMDQFDRKSSRRDQTEKESLKAMACAIHCKNKKIKIHQISYEWTTNEKWHRAKGHQLILPFNKPYWRSA